MEKKSIQEHRINQIFVAQLYSQAIPSSECPLCVRWQTSPPQLWAESCAPKTEGPQNRGPLPTLGTCEWNRIEKRGLCRHDCVERRQVGWALTSVLQR